MASWASIFHHGTALLLLAALVAGVPAAAGTGTLITPGDARVMREQRSLEGRLPSAAAGARIQLERSRRDLARPSNGIDYLPDGARYARELDRIEREVGRPAPAAPRPRRRGIDLPRSYGAETGLPSSTDAGGGTAAGGSNPLTAVARLLLRAERALGSGQGRRARSDLSVARAFLDDVAAAAPVADRRAALNRRLEELERQAAAADG